MKAIIKGKRYDTAKAVLINKTYGGSEYTTDLTHWEASLYRTPRSGAYFLAGQGGAMSRYSRALGGGSYSGGERIEPLTPEEAQRWAEEHLTPEEVEDAFGATIEDA